MNIFDNFLKKIKEIVLKNRENLNLENLNNFSGVTAENPPPEFNFLISCNIGLILAKINKQNPKDLSSKLKKLFLKEIKEINSIDIAGPGFLNIEIKDYFIKDIIFQIINLNTDYGSFKSNQN